MGDPARKRDLCVEVGESEELVIPEAPPLPFDIEAGRVAPGVELPDARLERRKRIDFNITWNMIRDHSGTEGWLGCDKA